MEVLVEIDSDSQVGGSYNSKNGDTSLIVGCGDNGFTFTGTKENIEKFVLEMKDAFDSLFPEVTE